MESKPTIGQIFCDMIKPDREEDFYKTLTCFIEEVATKKVDQIFKSISTPKNKTESVSGELSTAAKRKRPRKGIIKIKKHNISQDSLTSAPIFTEKSALSVITDSDNDTYSDVMDMEDATSQHSDKTVTSEKSFTSNTSFKSTATSHHNYTNNHVNTQSPQPSTSGINKGPVNKNQKQIRAAKPATQPATQTTVVGNKQVRVPPLNISASLNKDLNWEKLMNINNSNNIKLKEAAVTKTDDFRITPETSNDHRALTKALNDKDIQYYTFQLPEDKKLKGVIRGVDPNGNTDDFLAELIRLGYSALSVHKITTNRNNIRRNTPLIVVELERTNAGKEIYNLNRFMYLRITVETLRRRSGSGQCHRCQRFGHAANCCTQTRRCVRCSEDHMPNACPHKKKIQFPFAQIRGFSPRQLQRLS